MAVYDTVAALLAIWDELPALAGDDWSSLEPRLRQLLARFEVASDDETRARLSLQIQDLLEEEAPQVLAHLYAVSEGLEDVSRELLANRQRLATPGQILARLGELLSAPSPPVVRYTDVTCPRRVWVKTPRVSVVLRLTVRPADYSAAEEELHLHEGLPVRVRVDAPDFKWLNDPEQETTILPDEDSPPVVFDLRPLRVGHTRINLDFFQQGNPAGTVSLPVEVTAQRVEETAQPSPDSALHLEIAAAPPDLMLYITEGRSDDHLALVFTLFRTGEVGQTFHPVKLFNNAQTEASHLFAQLTALRKRLDPTVQQAMGDDHFLPPEEIDAQLRDLGLNLWRKLIPDELKRVYAAERENWRDSSLIIVSDEPYIPWELVKPYGPDWEEDEPWCLHFRLSRWLRRDDQGNGHEAPPARLELKALACLAPTTSGLPAAQKERRLLTRLAKQHDLEDLSPDAPGKAGVRALLESGQYDWLHVATHGDFYLEHPDGHTAVWLEDDLPLTPDTFVGPQIERHIRRDRPAFVLNACHAGRQGWALTGLGGWANRLISLGAGLFIGPQWTVTDGPAKEFARVFYEELLTGQPAAEAVRRARLAARREGDPTWLAYSLYAHPNATVQLTGDGDS